MRCSSEEYHSCWSVSRELGQRLAKWQLFFIMILEEDYIPMQMPNKQIDTVLS
jgi:hypothetical protein